jgi:pimeloyl-ACP methyl ester carboxylesterase
LSEKDFKFWDFSWDEMGRFDLPAMIDYIYKVKSKEGRANFSHHDLLFVGHSMGGTALLVMGVTRPEYSPKIRAAFLLAPVAYSAGVKPPLPWISQYAQQIQVKFWFPLQFHKYLCSF